MAVPDFQSCMLPALQVFADGKEHTNREVRERVAAALHVSDAEQEEPLPSGAMPAFNNRIYWALWYLRRCGLSEGTGRGVQRITDRGRQVLAKKPTRVDLKLLAQFPEFKALQRKGAAPAAATNGLDLSVGGHRGRARAGDARRPSCSRLG